MYCVLSQTPYEEFEKIEDKDTFAKETGFFWMTNNRAKKIVVRDLTRMAEWYSLFSNEPLYIYVISDSYWKHMIKGALRERISTWNTVPGNMLQTARYSVIPEEKRIQLGTEIDNMAEEWQRKILANNYALEDVVQIKLEAKV